MGHSFLGLSQTNVEKTGSVIKYVRSGLGIELSGTAPGWQGHEVDSSTKREKENYVRCK